MASRKAITLGAVRLQELVSGDYLYGNTPNYGDVSTNYATTAFVAGLTDGIWPLSTTGGTTTLTVDQAALAVIVVTGALTSNAIIIVPNSGLWTVSNGTTGSFSLTVKTSAGTGVLISPGTTRYLLANNTNVVRADAETPAAVQRVWDNGLIVTNNTYYYALSAPYPGVINGLIAITGVGTFTANVQINGTSVTGLSSVAVTSTKTTTNATALNTFAAGDTLTVVITSATSSPTNAVLQLAMTKL